MICTSRCLGYPPPQIQCRARRPVDLGSRESLDAPDKSWKSLFAISPLHIHDASIRSIIRFLSYTHQRTPHTLAQLCYLSSTSRLSFTSFDNFFFIRGLFFQRSMPSRLDSFFLCSVIRVQFSFSIVLAANEALQNHSGKDETQFGDLDIHISQING